MLGLKKSITGLENQDSDAIQAFKGLNEQGLNSAHRFCIEEVCCCLFAAVSKLGLSGLQATVN
jgi:hypothetical protein